MQRRRPYSLWVLASAIVIVSAITVAVWLRIPVRLTPEAVCAPTSTIVDRSGRTLGRIADPQLGYCDALPQAAFPHHLVQAIVATEDARFYQHHGVDPVGLARAAWLNLRAGGIVAGGSTLTQQVARMLVLGRDACYDRSPARKLREMALALRLEAQLSKDEILALYMNQVYWGDLAYGAGAASQAVFDKPVGQLDLAECALLAGMLQGPELYDPFENPEGARARQRVVLGLMAKQGYVTREASERAVHEPLTFRASRDATTAPHACALVEDQVEELLGQDVLAQGGLIIETALDADLQAYALEQTRLHLETLNRQSLVERGVSVADNAAVLALDVASGGILAMVGSPDHDDERIDGAVNACLTYRQPGSALKPFTYALAFGRGYGPASVVADVRTAYVGRAGELYVPVNYDYQFHGPVGLRQALACSYNGVAVQLLDAVGVDPWVAMMREVGFTFLYHADHRGLALTLGSGEVSLIELTAAYGTLASGGATVAPHLIERIVNSAGETLYEHEAAPPRQVLDPRLAYLIADILADDAARAPAFGEGGMLYQPFDAAAKTGTTTDWRDNWTVGYTPATVVGVWVGNADNRPMRGISGVDGAAPIWHGVLARAHPLDGGITFQRPPGVVEVEICPASGLLPQEACPHRRGELFLAEEAPMAACGVHTFVHVDLYTGEVADMAAGYAHVQRLPARLWSPELLAWADQRGLITEQDRAAMAQQVGSAAGAPLRAAADSDLPRILEPDPGARYDLIADIPAPHQRVPVVMTGDPSAGLARLLVDGAPATGWTTLPCQELWPLVPGAHTLIVEQVGDDGVRRLSAPVRIQVASESVAAVSAGMTDERTGL